MKKNILVIDPSIMIHKIVQLAFPEEAYSVFISEGYPVTCDTETPLNLVLISADLPGQDDVHDVIAQLKNTYDCPMLLMIPKFHEFDTALAKQAGVDETIEKPFTSDALKEKVAGISTMPSDLDQMESLSAEELESITDDEFMLSEEDLMDIGEEDLADVEIPEDLPTGDEPDTSDLPETEAVEAPVAETPTEDESEPDLDIPVSVTAQEVEDPNSEEDMPFEDMEIEDDLDSIDFGDVEGDEQLLAEAELADISRSSKVEPPAEPMTEEEADIKAGEEAPLDGEMDVRESRPADSSDETESITEQPEVPLQVQVPDEEEPPPAEPSASPVFEEPEEEMTDLPEPDFSLPEEAPQEEPDDDINVDFAIEDEPQTVQMGSYEVEEPEPVAISEEPADDEAIEMEREEEVKLPPEPIDLSRDESDGEIIHPPSSLRDMTAGGASLSEADIDRIAQRVVEIMGDRTVREIAWEVIPVVAEEMVSSRIRELEEDSGD